MILSCSVGRQVTEMDEMYFLVNNFLAADLSLIKTNGRRIIDRKQIIDLRTIRLGSRIIQAGFLSLEKVYVIFEGSREISAESTVYLRIYDINNGSWEDVLIFRSELENIRLFDLGMSGGYFSGRGHNNRLMYLDFNRQVHYTILEFPRGKVITSINSCFNEHIIINTHERQNNIYRYYVLDKNSHEKLIEGIGQIHVNKHSNLVIHKKESNIYIVKDLFNPTIIGEIPNINGKVLSEAFAVSENAFILSFISTRRDHLGSFLFGGNRAIEQFRYQFIRILDGNELDLPDIKIQNLNIVSNNQIIFDVLKIK